LLLAGVHRDAMAQAASPETITRRFIQAKSNYGSCEM
jgi:hypothetical protein